MIWIFSLVIVDHDSTEIYFSFFCCCCCWYWFSFGLTKIVTRGHLDDPACLVPSYYEGDPSPWHLPISWIITSLLLPSATWAPDMLGRPLIARAIHHRNKSLGISGVEYYILQVPVTWGHLDGPACLVPSYYEGDPSPWQERSCNDSLLCEATNPLPPGVTWTAQHAWSPSCCEGWSIIMAVGDTVLLDLLLFSSTALKIVKMFRSSSSSCLLFSSGYISIVKVVLFLSCRCYFFVAISHILNFRSDNFQST